MNEDKRKGTYILVEECFRQTDGIYYIMKKSEGFIVESHLKGAPE